MARGEPIWQTSSTGPTSMPSSREAVATRARRSPARSRCSTIRRRAADRLPWWAATWRAASIGSTGGGRSATSAGPSAPPASLASPGAQPEGQLVGHPLGHLAGVDEDERGAVLEDVGGDPVQDVGELGAAGHRLELAVRELDGHVEVAPVPAVDDGGGGSGRVHPGQQAGHHVERSLGGRQPDALQPVPPGRHQVGQPLEAQGQVGAPLVAGQGVHLVDDDGVDAPEHGPRRRRGQQQVERLRGGDQQVGGRPPHGRPLGGRGVAGPDGHRELRGGQTQSGGLVGDAGQRQLQVLVDVDGERPQRGDVDDPGPGPGCAGAARPSAWAR